MHIDLQLLHEQATKPTAERIATWTFSIESSEDSIPWEIVLEDRSDSTIGSQHQPMSFQHTIIPSNYPTQKIPFALPSTGAIHTPTRCKAQAVYRLHLHRSRSGSNTTFHNLYPQGRRRRDQIPQSQVVGDRRNDILELSSKALRGFATYRR